MAKGLLFSGQGAQYVGMGKTLCEHSEIARNVYELANEILGWDLKNVCFNGPDKTLTETRVCQPALYTQGYAIYKMLTEKGLTSDIKAVFGLSLGELTALAVAGVYDFETGLRLVAERGRLMQEACNSTEGGMASLIGGNTEKVEELCKDFKVEIANYNCPGQIVISGNKVNILQAVAASKDMGFKLVKPLNVAGAYHSSLMESAKIAFAEFIAPIEFKSPHYEILTNVTGNIIKFPEDIKKAIVNQIVSSVRFESCIIRSKEDLGINHFIECGPARVLAGLVRRTDKSIEVQSISEFADLDCLI